MMRPGGRPLRHEAGGLRWFARAWNLAALPSRQPVVLVHGLVVSSRYMVPTGRLLGRSLPVLAPDLPGFGRSEGPPETLDVDGLADALAEWAGAVGIPRAAWLANSIGCHVVLALGERHPDLVDRLVLVGPALDPDRPGTPWQTWALLRDVPRERWRLPFVHATDVLRAGAKRSWETFRHTLADPLDERAPRVRAPTLVVRGGRDPLVTPEWAERLAALLPAGQLVTVPDAPHALNYSAPRRLAREVLPFLASAPSPAAPAPRAGARGGRAHS